MGNTDLFLTRCLPGARRLRELQDRNVKLAVDLLEFEEPVAKAVWYACGNTLVTETLEQAKSLAYGTAPRPMLV